MKSIKDSKRHSICSLQKRIKIDCFDAVEEIENLCVLSLREFVELQTSESFETQFKDFENLMILNSAIRGTKLRVKTQNKE